MSWAAENQLHTCRTSAPVVMLSDKWEIFRLFAFDRKDSNYSTNIEYTRRDQYSNVVKFELRHIPKVTLCNPYGTRFPIAVWFRLWTAISDLLYFTECEVLNWLLAIDCSAMTSRWLRTVHTADLTVGRCTNCIMNRWDCTHIQVRLGTDRWNELNSNNHNVKVWGWKHGHLLHENTGAWRSVKWQVTDMS